MSFSNTISHPPEDLKSTTYRTLICFFFRAPSAAPLLAGMTKRFWSCTEPRPWLISPSARWWTQQRRECIVCGPPAAERYRWIWRRQRYLSLASARSRSRSSKTKRYATTFVARSSSQQHGAEENVCTPPRMETNVAPLCSRDVKMQKQGVSRHCLIPEIVTKTIRHHLVAALCCSANIYLVL